MKRNITVLCSTLIGVFCTLLSICAEGGSFKITVLNSSGQPIPGVTGSYYSSGWKAMGTTSDAGVIEKMLPNGSYNIELIYKKTSLKTNITVDDGNPEFVFYTSKLEINAVTYNNNPVPDVSSTFHPSAGQQSLGTTDASGRATTELFPGTLVNFKSTVNGTSNANREVEVPGDGLTPGVVVPVQVQVVTVNFSSAGSLSYYAGGYKNINKDTNKFMMAGTYRLYVGSGNRVSREVEINPANLLYEKVATVIEVKDSEGEYIAASQIRGGYDAPSSWTYSNSALEALQAIEGVGRYIHISEKSNRLNRTYEVRVNNTVSLLTQDITKKNFFSYQTSLLQLNITDCYGNGIEGVSARYKTNYEYHWPNSVKSDAQGRLTMQAFPATFGFIEVKIGNIAHQKVDVVFTGTNSFNWSTTSVKFHYPHKIYYGGSNGNSQEFTNESQLLPGITKFSFRGPGGISAVVDIDIPEGGCSFEKTPVFVRLLNSKNSPLAGGSVQFYQNSWKPALGETGANGNTLVLFDGKVTRGSLATTYLGTREQKDNVDFASIQNVLVFNTLEVLVTLQNNEGDPLDGYELQYYANSWKNFGDGTITGGEATFEMLTGSYAFALRLNGSRQQISYHNLGENPVVEFVAKRVSLSLKNLTGAGISGANGTYYAVSWRTIGVTGEDGLTPFVYLLPGNEYTFEVTEGAWRLNRKVALTGSDDLVIEFTDERESSNADRIVELEEEDEDDGITVYPNPSVCQVNIKSKSGRAIVEIYAKNGKKLQHFNTHGHQVHIDVSRLPRDIYTVVVREGKSVRSKRIIKD